MKAALFVTFKRWKQRQMWWHPAVFSGREKWSKEDQELHRKFQVRPGYIRSCLIFFFKILIQNKKRKQVKYLLADKWINKAWRDDAGLKSIAEFYFY